jgi:hypothetical protein
MVVGDDPALVIFMNKYVGKVLLDADADKIYVVRVLQYDERGGREYYEAANLRVEQGKGGSWAVPSVSPFSGSEVLKNELLVGNALMNLSEPKAPCDKTISAQSPREMAVQKRARRAGWV